jgi:hypothetical protein
MLERVVFVPASAQSVLLDAAADFVDDLGAEPDHVKGVKHGDRVGQPFMNGVRIFAALCQLVRPSGGVPCGITCYLITESKS